MAGSAIRTGPEGQPRTTNKKSLCEPPELLRYPRGPITAFIINGFEVLFPRRTAAVHYLAEQYDRLAAKLTRRIQNRTQIDDVTRRFTPAATVPETGEMPSYIGGLA